MSDQTDGSDTSLLDSETESKTETTTETKPDVDKDSFFEDGFGKWTAALPKDMQKDERLKGMKGPGDAVKRWFDLEGKVGEVPDKPADYDFEVPELPEGMPFDKENVITFKNLAYTTGMSKEAAAKVFSGFMDFQISRFRQEMNDRKISRENATKTLHEDWPGEEFNKNVELAKRVYRTFGDDDLKQIINDTGLSNEPAMLRFLAKVGKVISEDVLVEGEKGGKEKAESIYDAAYPSMKDMPDRQ